MGGGASLMVPMKFSVVTEKTVSINIVSLFLTALITSSAVTSGFFCGTFHERFNRFFPLQKLALAFILIVVSHICFPIFPGISVSIAI